MCLRRIILYCKFNKFSRENNLSIPTNYIQIIEKYENISHSKRIIVRLSWLYGTKESCLNASSAISNCVIFNQSWLYRVVFFDGLETNNAFKMTLGHELTHKENDLLPLKGIIYDINGYCFIAWCNKVHADFGAVVKFAELDRNKQIQAMEYKLNLKKDDKPSLDHPSWCQRIEYVKNYDFDEILIRKIAEDTNCHNEKLIQKVIEHFEPIYLK